MKITSFRGKYRFLSNFYPCKIEYEGIEYPSTEHAYQAAKFDDSGIREEISKLPTPTSAKQAGKFAVVPDDWREKSLQVMHDVCTLKFSQEPFRTQLIDTAPAELVEGNTWGDTFWGVCDGEGSNYLGRILMDIRNRLVLGDEVNKKII